MVVIRRFLVHVVFVHAMAESSDIGTQRRPLVYPCQHRKPPGSQGAAKSNVAPVLAMHALQVLQPLRPTGSIPSKTSKHTHESTSHSFPFVSESLIPGCAGQQRLGKRRGWGPGTLQNLDYDIATGRGRFAKFLR